MSDASVPTSRYWRQQAVLPDDKRGVDKVIRALRYQRQQAADKQTSERVTTGLGVLWQEMSPAAL